MSQSFLVLFTKCTNHKIDYNHFSNQFKRLTLKNCGGLVSIYCFEKNLKAILQTIFHTFFIRTFKNDY